jgi:hypothetical protein
MVMPKLSLFVIILLLPCFSRAWSSAGHQTIAAGAYRQLTSEVKARVAEILKAHPEYQKWEQSFRGDDEGLDLQLYIFMRASTWPDEIRRKGNKYDHPHWHYIDYPIRSPRFPLEAEPSPTDNVVFGIEQSAATLKDGAASAEERAVALSWLIHLVGDIHQPLHCASFFSDVFPSGDKGGNDSYIRPGSRGIKLHSFWDGLLGTSGKPQAHLSYAVQLQEHPMKSFKQIDKQKAAKDWSLEGRQLAIEKAYWHGGLKQAKNLDEAVDVPEGYTKEAKATAEKQAALATCRLATLITATLSDRALTSSSDQ